MVCWRIDFVEAYRLGKVRSLKSGTSALNTSQAPFLARFIVNIYQ
jgi:hypothetical protein